MNKIKRINSSVLSSEDPSKHYTKKLNPLSNVLSRMRVEGL